MYPKIEFIYSSEKRWYGKTIKYLENVHTKGNIDYIQDIVKSYQLLNEFKNFNPRHNQVPKSDEVSFEQDQTKICKTNKKKYEGKYEKQCC